MKKTKFSQALADVMSYAVQEAYKLTKKDFSTKELGSLKYLKRKKVVVDGLKINYLTRGEKNKQPLIFLHGLFGSSFVYRKLLNILSKKFRVYAFDMPGWGKSDKLKKTMTSEEYSDFAYKAARKLKIKKPIMVGHSAGGMHTISITLNHPNYPKKIILVNSAGLRLPYTLKQLYNKILNPKNKKKLYAKEHMWRELIEFIKNIIKFFTSYIARKMMVIGFSTTYEHRLKEIKTPTLILWSNKDGLFPLKYARKFHRKIPNSELVIFRGNHHWIISHPKMIYKVMDKI